MFKLRNINIGTALFDIKWLPVVELEAIRFI